MNVLVACEESQIVCSAFRNLGHNAFSCDIVLMSGDHPEWHINTDVLKILEPPVTFRTVDGSLYHIDTWDLIIAHPPCTYLSNAGARHLYPHGSLNHTRYYKGLDARNFFMSIYNSSCKHICVENPVPFKIFHLPSPSQVIEPWMFGHPYSKRTYLWLKGLPPLFATCICDSFESTTTAAWFNKGGKSRQSNRSKTFSGVASAMASQWGSL